MSKTEIEGWDSWANWIDGLDDAITQEVGEEVYKKGLEIESEAKWLAPVDTGRLEESINTEAKGKGKKVEVEVGTDVEYADSVEFGTFKQSAQPFLMPAFNKVARSFQKDLSAIVNRELD